MKKLSKIQELQNEVKHLKDMQVSNSLTGLVQAAQAQSNLTSFNPIIQNNLYAPLTINWTMLMYMYKTHGIIQTALDMPVMDALRGGIEIKSDELSPDEIKDLQDDIEQFGILKTVQTAKIWARLFGGGGIIINTDQNPETPLNEKKIRKLEFYACNRWELITTWKPNVSPMAVPWDMYANRTQDHFYFYGTKFDSTRIITLSGKEAPYILRWQLQGWGMSEIERMVPDFDAYIKTKEVTYELLEEAKIDVYRLKDLNSQLSSASGTTLTRQRIQLMNELKSFNRAIVMDILDEFEQKQITFAGLAEVMKQNQIGIASALRMPLSKIFGLSATGFNSGEDDIENYNAMVESEVRQELRTTLRQVIGLLCVLKFGYLPSFSLEYKPLRVMSSLDEENIKTQKHSRYLADYQAGLLTSQEYGQLCQMDKLIAIETQASKGMLDEHPMPEGNEGEEKDSGKSKSAKE